MSFFENTRKPEGLGGKLMLAMMNVGHRALADWGLQFAEIAKNARVLDCGCGGGANIRTMLKKCPNGEVKGVDYSPVSVEKAKKVNEDAILNGRCVILQGNVADLIFAANQFDLVTAFETIYFWPDLCRVSGKSTECSNRTACFSSATSAAATTKRTRSGQRRSTA